MIYFRSLRLLFSNANNLNLCVGIITIAVFFVFFSSVFVIGHYQSHNGDFGQYFIHAQNLLKGRAWSYSLEGYPAVLPLYPYLLAVVTYFFGVNAFYYALLNTLMWAVTCITWCSIYAKRFTSNSAVPVYMLFIVFLPFVVSFQQEALPNIMFAMCCALSIKAVMICEEKGTSIFWMFIILLPALVRVESIALFFSYTAYLLLNRRYKFSIIGLAGIILTVFIDCYIGINHEMKSNFLVLQDFNSSNVRGAESQLLNTLIAIVHLASSYLLGFGEMIIPKGLSESSRLIIDFSNNRVLAASYASFVILLIFMIGFIKKENFLKMDFLIFTFLLGLISLFPLPEAPIRYLLPILPIFAFYFINALLKMIKSGVETHSTSSILTFLLLIPLFYFSLIIAVDEPKRRNFLFNKYTTEMADWVAENRNNRKIAFFKPRLMVVLMDIRNENNDGYDNLRDVKAVGKLIENNALIVVFKTPGYRQVEILNYLKDLKKSEKLWENNSYVVFGENSF